MGAQLRVFRRRIRSVQATKKITKAMELIASSRIVKAQQRLEASTPYLLQLTQAVSAAASHASDIGNHPLVRAPEVRDRAAVLVITADRGLAGAYSVNAIREAAALTRLLNEQGLQVTPYVVGRKGVAWYRFRGVQMGGGVHRLHGPADVRRRPPDRRRSAPGLPHAGVRGRYRRDPHRLHPLHQHGRAAGAGAPGAAARDRR